MAPPRSAICTLYEGHYHYGAAALINSLSANGFVGHFYLGYRGSIAPWAGKAAENKAVNWPGTKTLALDNGISLHFLPVDTTTHFTNYKAEFMLSLWYNCIGNNSKTPGIFYFDPDIVVKANWDFFEKWITYGVAVVHEVVWNDLPPTHPKRKMWGEVAAAAGVKVKNEQRSYINAGFFGLNKHSLAFLELLKKLMDVGEQKFGLDKTKFFQNSHDYAYFKVADQDLLNLTIMCTDVPVSEFGPDGMDFISGGWLMSHAAGGAKPWMKNFFLSSLSAKPPARQDKCFWAYATGPIKMYKKNYIAWKRFWILVASFVGRFYSRN